MHDFFLYDTDRLYDLTSAEVVKQGLDYFTENRVFALALSDNGLTAQIEDAEHDEPVWLHLQQQDQRLQVDCDCHEGAHACKHAVAAFYAYADQCGFDDQQQLLGNAVDEAIQERVKKGRNEVRVKLLSGNLGFGT